MDPEIVLKAKAFNLNVGFFYSSVSDVDEEYGRRRSASAKSYVVSQLGADNLAMVVKGDLGKYTYIEAGTSGGVTTYTAANIGYKTTLTFTTGQFIEHYPDGMRVFYEKQTAANRYEVVRVAMPESAALAAVAQTYTYGTSGEAGLLKTVTVPGGDKVTFTYVASSPTSLLSSIEDWANRRWTFQYDAGRQLTTLIAPTGCTTKYGYSFAGAGSPNTMLHTIEDPRGFRTTYMYSAAKQVVSMAAGSGVWTYTYNNDGASLNTVVTTPSGARTTSHFGGGAEVTVVEKPEGYRITYTYDGNGFKTAEILPLSISHAWTNSPLGLLEAYRDPVGNRTTYMYDPSLNLTTERRPPRVTLSTFATAGPSRTTAFRRSSRGRP